MVRKQQELAEVILKDPAVESLSSFIGVDGINTTLNSGRILINLKPLEDAQHQRLGRHEPLAAETGSGGGDRLLHATGAGLDRGRPRQPDPVSNTRWKIPTRRNCACGRTNSWRNSRRLPELRDVATDDQPGGLQTKLVIDRVTASRLGITAASDRQHALRRLRPARRSHAIHAIEPVSCGAGSDAGFPNEPVET